MAGHELDSRSTSAKRSARAKSRFGVAANNTLLTLEEGNPPGLAPPPAHGRRQRLQKRSRFFCGSCASFALRIASLARKSI
jgi:hypothetical protein